MIVSWNWLTEYLKLDLPVEALAERLTLSGLNLESISDVGGDLAIDLEVTSNRSDCLCHLGIAREIGVLLERSPRFPDPRPATRGRPASELTSVDVEATELCPRFTARVVSGARVGESPWWLKKRLETIGVRSINNIVDITNYVMFECGQPLHAYDLDRLAEKRLMVRKAKPGESLIAINNRVYDLNPAMLVIADAARPVGLAGVMGGAETEINPTTRNVLIEAARFDPGSVRATSRALGLFSPSSFRFERPIDPEVVDWASRRCAQLVVEIAGGTLHPGVIDHGEGIVDRLVIRLREAAIERILGVPISLARASELLTRLGLAPASERAGEIEVIAPSWRPDLEREIDLIEEVARLHGYDHIPGDRAVALTSATRSRRERVESAAREAMIGCGFDEAATFSLVDERLALGVGPESTAPPLRVDHASRKRESSLRMAIAPSLLAARAYNEARGRGEAELFEIAQVYLPRGDREIPNQPTRLALVTGRDFRRLKGVVEALLERLHVTGGLSAHPVDSPLFELGRSAELRLGGEVLGYLGEVAASQRGAMDLRGPCSAAELDLDLIEARARLVPPFTPPPQYPPVSRDLSVVLATERTWDKLESVVREAAGDILESVDYLDTFRGGGLAEGEQSVHFGMIFRRSERTLTGDEVDRAIEAVTTACRERLGAKLRG